MLTITVGASRRLRAKLMLLLVLAASLTATQAVLDFDLNEPATPETSAQIQDNGELEDEEFTQTSGSNFVLSDSEWRPFAVNAPLRGLGNVLSATHKEESNIYERGKARALGAWKKVKAKLPAYFSFEKFRKQMHRKYSSGEILYRKSRFLSQCMEVLKARVNYRLGLVGHLEDVNKFADRSPNELSLMFMSGPPIEFWDKQAKNEEAYREMLNKIRAERERNDLELESQYSFSDDEDEDEQATAVKAFTSKSSATIISEKEAEHQIELLLASSTLVPELRNALEEELVAAKIITSSQAAADDDENPKKPLPWPGQQKAPSDGKENHNQQVDYEPPELAPNDSLDWSEHQCFHTIYEQPSNCGNCYVIATTTIAEFYKCTEEFGRIIKRKFSKEYVQDCGQKFSPTILGCAGGSLVDTLRFISTAGMLTIRNWRVKRENQLIKYRKQGIYLSPLDTRCPMDQFDTPINKWGDVRVELRPWQVHANEWYAALQDGPFVVSVQMPARIIAYSGGTHSGEDCDKTNNWHAMVLVGYGTDERGVAYWRFRNSWGSEWGDGGHLNLAMSVPGRCLVGGVRVFREPLPA